MGFLDSVSFRDGNVMQMLGFVFGGFDLTHMEMGLVF